MQRLSPLVPQPEFEVRFSDQSHPSNPFLKDHPRGLRLEVAGATQAASSPNPLPHSSAQA